MCYFNENCIFIQFITLNCFIQNQTKLVLKGNLKD